MFLEKCYETSRTFYYVSTLSFDQRPPSNKTYMTYAFILKRRYMVQEKRARVGVPCRTHITCKNIVQVHACRVVSNKLNIDFLSFFPPVENQGTFVRTRAVRLRNVMILDTWRQGGRSCWKFDFNENAITKSTDDGDDDARTTRRRSECENTFIL